jgi:hypothetical protein
LSDKSEPKRKYVSLKRGKKEEKKFPARLRPSARGKFGPQATPDERRFIHDEQDRGYSAHQIRQIVNNAKLRELTGWKKMTLRRIRAITARPSKERRDFRKEYLKRKRLQREGAHINPKYRAWGILYRITKDTKWSDKLSADGHFENY